jgi:DNA polymerase-3 subunit delta'
MMTVEASNALLKVLEEPPKGSLLILLSSKRELLLPTIVSRCTEVRFNSLSLEETEKIILEKGDANKETARFLAYFSEGSPGKALDMLEAGVLEDRKDLAEMLGRITRVKEASLLAWNKEGKDALLEDLEILIMFFRDIALDKEGLEDFLLDKDLARTEAGSFFKRYPIEKISAVIEKLIGLKRALLGNVNPKLVAQSLPLILK